DDGGSKPCADREEREIVDTAGRATPLLPEGGEVDVVFQSYGKLERVFELRTQVDIASPENVTRQRYAAVGLRDDSGDPHDHVREPIGVEPHRFGEGAAQGCDGGER